MKTVAFLGLGAMGSRMASRLVQAGFTVKVWNRTPKAAETLLQQGAIWANTPREAAENADFVIAMVRDIVKHPKNRNSVAPPCRTICTVCSGAPCYVFLAILLYS